MTPRLPRRLRIMKQVGGSSTAAATANCYAGLCSEIGSIALPSGTLTAWRGAFLTCCFFISRIRLTCRRKRCRSFSHVGLTGAVGKFSAHVVRGNGLSIQQTPAHSRRPGGVRAALTSRRPGAASLRTWLGIINRSAASPRPNLECGAGMCRPIFSMTQKLPGGYRVIGAVRGVDSPTVLNE